MHGPEHVNQIFLLDSTKVPDGQPTGVTFEKLRRKNYPDLAESELKEDFLPFLVRKCAVDRLDAFRTMMKHFDRHGRIDKKGTILSELSVFFIYAFEWKLTLVFFVGLQKVLLVLANRMCSTMSFNSVVLQGGLFYTCQHVSLDCLRLQLANMRLLTISHTLHSVGSLKDYDNESAARTTLKCFLEAEAEKLKEIEYNKNGLSLHDFISSGLDNEKYFETWKEFFSLISAEELK